MKKHVLVLSLMVLIGCCLNLAYASGIQKHGDAYVVYLSGDLNVDEVVALLKNEIHGQNWQIVSEMNIGEAVKEHEKSAENRVLSVCNLRYLSEAVETDPFISLIIPCRFTVFRLIDEKDNNEQIVVGFYDPIAEANALNLKQAQAVQIATDELKKILMNVLDFYSHH